MSNSSSTTAKSIFGFKNSNILKYIIVACHPFYECYYKWSAHSLVLAKVPVYFRHKNSFALCRFVYLGIANSRAGGQKMSNIDAITKVLWFCMWHCKYFALFLTKPNDSWKSLEVAFHLLCLQSNLHLSFLLSFYQKTLISGGE